MVDMASLSQLLFEARAVRPLLGISLPCMDLVERSERDRGNKNMLKN